MIFECGAAAAACQRGGHERLADLSDASSQNIIISLSPCE